MRTPLNDFEDAILNAEYRDDIYEQRKIIGKIVEYFLQISNPEFVQILESEQEQGTLLRNVFFKIYDEFYIWGDVIMDGIVEASQLEYVVNRFVGEVLWSTEDNAPSTTAAFFKMYYSHQFKLVENRQ